jgi:predicted DNA-binding transcriptional regulator AlpA
MTTTTSHPEWLTTKQLAAEIGVSIHTLYKWTRRGWPYCPRSCRLANGELRFLRPDIEAWRMARRQLSGA